MDIRVLIVDDSEDDALLVVHNLRQQGYNVIYERVDTSKGLKSALDRNDWDVVISDYSMPHFTGMSALALIRQQNKELPCIVFSGMIGESTAVDMMRAGASDYIMKDNIARLAPAIEREMAEAKVRIEKRHADITIAQQRDFLTTVIDSLDYHFYVIDAKDYTVKLANKAVKECDECHGWEDGITCYALTHNRQSPCDCRQHPCSLEEVVRTGESSIVEYINCNKESKVRNLEVHAHPIFDSEGNVSQVIQYFFDITERKKQEAELLENQNQLRDLAVQLSSSEEQERRRIAEGLHDDIIQPLAFLDIKLKTILDSEANQGSMDSYQKMRKIIKELINQVRDFTFELSYPVLYELGFEKAVRQWLVTEIKEKHGLAFEFVTDIGQIRLNGDMQDILFKAIKELLVNVVKHAHAGNVKVSLTKDQDNIMICVEDDGVGFPVNMKPNEENPHFGLLNIRHRIDYLGGCFEIESRHGSGTKAVISVPLQRGKQLKGATG